MPEVNGVPFPYTPSGKKAASKAAKASGTKMKTKKPSGIKAGKRIKGGM